MIFRSMAFGDAVLFSDPRLYTHLEQPLDVKKFMSGSYQANGLWSVALPDSREQREYEQSMISLINATINAQATFKPGDPTLKNAQVVFYDINTFKNYLQVKYQVLNGWTTPTAWNYIYQTYWGDYNKMRTVDLWLNDQASIAMQELMDSATLMVGTANAKITGGKLDFYQNVVVPLANKFSQSDQSFLREVFVLDMDGEVTLEDLLKAVRLIAPYLTMAQFSQIYLFASQMVLGSDLASNMLNTSSQLPYYDRKIGAEIAEITAKYRAVASRLGKYLDPNTEALFQERLRIHQAGYQNPNDPQYYVCGKVCDTIMSNVLSPIGNEIAKLQGLTKDGKATAYSSDVSQKITENVKSAIIDSISQDTKNMVDPGAFTPEMVQKYVNQAESQVVSLTQDASKKSAFPWLLLLVGGYLLTKGKN